MSFFRLIKPKWAKPELDNGDPNPEFIQEIQGLNSVDIHDLDSESLKTYNDQGYNIYFFPNHPSKDVLSEGVKYLSGKHIDVFNYVFVDMDLKDQKYKSKEEFIAKLMDFPLKPTTIIDSGNGVHAYWKIKDLTRELYVLSQLALIKYFSTDESIWTVLQIMRLPGFNNTKKFGNFVPCKVLDSSSDQEYEFSQFPEDLITSLSPEELRKAETHINKLDGKVTVDLPNVEYLEEIPDRFLEFIEDPKNQYVYKLFKFPKETKGDRSKADMTLANILFKADFNRKEALAIISNTQKALERGSSRFQYAECTVDKVYADRLFSKYKTVAQELRVTGGEQNLGMLVRGTTYFDSAVLGNPWRKKEVMGLIAGPGVGKTSVTLKWIKDAIENNGDNDDIYIFISLEMTKGAVINRWVSLVGPNSPLADRLYVISNEDDNGDPRNIGLQEVYEISTEIKKMTGKNIGMLAIDHIGILAKHINTEKKYTFGIMSEVNAGWGAIRTLSLNSMARNMKLLAKMLDTFLIVLTQTTKEKGKGDIPIEKDGAYGISDYENIMDRIVTIWQPLQRVQAQTQTRFLAWQYVKIREMSINDRVQRDHPQILVYDLGSGELRQCNQSEFAEFNRLKPLADAARDAAIKKKSNNYSMGIDTTKLDEKLKAFHEKGTVNELAKIQSH